MTRDFELVLPAYNEAETLAKLIERVAQAAQAHALTPPRFCLVVVNNGSTDATAAVLKELAEGPYGSLFRVVTVPHNRGYGFGVFAGLKATDAHVVGFSHADLQCDPNDAFKAWASLQKADDKVLVKGVRSGRQFKDKVVSRVFERCASLILGMQADEINAQPKVFSRALLGELRHPPHTFAFDLYVLYQAHKAGYALHTVPVHFPPRQSGTSKWAATLLGRYKTILGIINYMWQLRVREGRL